MLPSIFRYLRRVWIAVKENNRYSRSVRLEGFTIVEQTLKSPSLNRTLTAEFLGTSGTASLSSVCSQVGPERATPRAARAASPHTTPHLVSLIPPGPPEQHIFAFPKWSSGRHRQRITSSTRGILFDSPHRPAWPSEATPESLSLDVAARCTRNYTRPLLFFLSFPEQPERGAKSFGELAINFQSLLVSSFTCSFNMLASREVPATPRNYFRPRRRIQSSFEG